MLIDDILPRHGHRTPAELADDEILSAMRGDGAVYLDGRRCSPDRHEAVTLHSSRLFPVRMADLVGFTTGGPTSPERNAPRNAAKPEGK